MDELQEYEYPGMYHIVKEFSNYQRSLLSSLNMDAYSSILNVVSSYSKYPKQDTTILESITEALQTITSKQVSDLVATGLLSVSDRVIKQFLLKQNETYALIAQSSTTEMLKAVNSAFISIDYSKAISTISNALSQPLIEAADLAFVKRSDIVKENFPVSEYTSGMKNLIAKLNVGSAIRLSNCDDVSYESSTRKFINENNPDNKASVSEMNTLCSAADLFEYEIDLGEGEFPSESELIDFMSFLSDTPTFAAMTRTGQMINRIVGLWRNRMNFELPLYYHARARNKDARPYTYDEMLRAPVGVSGPGRFNYAGQAHYYFSNTKDGAKSEVEKHSRQDTVIQIAEVRPIRSAKIIDFSRTMRKGVVFLKYIRFDLADMNNKMPKEYLIPCFVADCCRRNRIDGIKYYGGAEYFNYVCWNDGYFEISRMI